MDERRKDHIVYRMQRRFEQLGYKVHLEPITSVAACRLVHVGVNILIVMP